MHSIGDFAEQLISQKVGNIKEGKELPPSQTSDLPAAGKDISNIKVPDTFMKEVLGESYHPQDIPATNTVPELVWTEPEEPKTPGVLTEETAQQLLPLLGEVRDLLKEMTTAGMMGVNLAGPQKDDTSWEKVEKKAGYLTAKAGAKTRKQVLKQSIRSKLRKK